MTTANKTGARARTGGELVAEVIANQDKCRCLVGDDFHRLMGWKVGAFIDYLMDAFHVKDREDEEKCIRCLLATSREFRERTGHRMPLSELARQATVLVVITGGTDAHLEEHLADVPMSGKPTPREFQRLVGRFCVDWMLTRGYLR